MSSSSANSATTPWGIPQNLCRTFAQIGYESGVPIIQINKQLGHSSNTTTQRYLNMDLDLITKISDFIPLN